MTSLRLRMAWLAVAGVLACLVPAGARALHGADLKRYIASDFCAAIVIHPERINQSTLAEAARSGLPKPLSNADPLKAALDAAKQNPQGLPPGMDPAKLADLLKDKPIHRIVLLAEPLPGPKTGPQLPVMPGVGIIVQFSADIDGEAIISAACSQWQPATTEGTAYKVLRVPGQTFAALAPDARTLIFGSETSVKKMLAKEPGAQPLLKQLQHTSLDNDIIIEAALDIAAMQTAQAMGTTVDELLAGAKLEPGQLAMAKDVKSISIALNLSGKTLIHGELVTTKPDTAAGLAGMANAGIAQAKPAFESVKKNPSPLIPKPLMDGLAKVGDEVLAGQSVKADGNRVLLEVPMPESLADLLKQAAAMGNQQKPPGGP